MPTRADRCRQLRHKPLLSSVVSNRSILVRRAADWRHGWQVLSKWRPHLRQSGRQSPATHSLKRLWRTGIQMRNRPAERAQIVLLRYPLKNRQYRVGAVIGIGRDPRWYSPFAANVATPRSAVLSCSRKKNPGHPHQPNTIILATKASPDPESQLPVDTWHAPGERPSGC